LASVSALAVFVEIAHEKDVLDRNWL